MWSALTLSLMGNGTRLPNQGAIATARGNAFVATADDPSGLIQAAGNELLVGGYAFTPKVTYESPNGTRSQMETETFVLPQVYYAHHEEGSRWAWGTGVYVPWGQSSDWGPSGPFPTLATRNEVEFITGAVSAAFRVSEQLSVGAGVQFNQVKSDLRRTIGFMPGDLMRFEGDGNSWGGNFGMLWSPDERHVWGVNYQTETSVEFDGTLETSPYAPTVDARATMPYPDFITLGYSFRPTPQWNLELAIDWTNWERLNSVAVRSAGAPVALTFDWDSSLYWLLGGSYRTGDWSFHGGYIYSENSVPDATFGPAVVDTSRHLFSAGAEFQSGPVTWMLVVQTSPTSSRTVRGSTPSAVGQSADGTYDVSILGAAFSAVFTF